MLVVLVLIFLVVERIVPGYGLPTSVLLGAGTLLLPFATLYFDHVLSAALGFAAFAVLFLERETRPGGWLLAAAGVLAGLAVVVEFPLAVVAVVLGIYAALGAGPVRRAAAYTGGLVVGVLPLAAFNTWAFGSPWTLGYTNALKAPAGSGTPVVGANAEGFYGVGFPDPRAAVSLLVSEKGLLIVTPLTLAAAAGLPLLYRSGRRAETFVCGVVPLLFLAYNAGYYLPFGGQGPGPRFLIPALPFLALPLGFALRARPLVVAGIGVASIAVMALATLTGPLTGVEYGIGTWLGRLGRSDLAETLIGRLGASSAWLGGAVFLLLLVSALALALARLPLRAALRTDGWLLGNVLGAWLLLVVVAPELVPADEEHGTLEGVLAVVALGAILAISVLFTRGERWVALLAVAPALVLAAPQLTSRPRWSLLVATLLFGLAAVVWARGRDARARVGTARAAEPPPPEGPLVTPR